MLTGRLSRLTSQVVIAAGVRSVRPQNTVAILENFSTEVYARVNRSSGNRAEAIKTISLEEITNE
jgi:hypothetical protein